MVRDGPGQDGPKTKTARNEMRQKERENGSEKLERKKK